MLLKADRFCPVAMNALPMSACLRDGRHSAWDFFSEKMRWERHGAWQSCCYEQPEKMLSKDVTKKLSAALVPCFGMGGAVELLYHATLGSIFLLMYRNIKE